MIIEQVGPVKDLPAKGNYGPSKIYSVKFKESDNWADVFRSADKPAPAIGESMEGTIEKTQYGYSFRKAKTGFTPRAGGSGMSNKQVALGAAVKIEIAMGDVTSSGVIDLANEFLKWLDTYAVAIEGSAPKEAPSDQPPVSNYEDLGI